MSSKVEACREGICRVDSDVGYLPAEHIETPTERLARLNKHRNIDVCLLTQQYRDAATDLSVLALCDHAQ